ncbi:MAG TPA: Gfo/Idh/MocA family oxidoreductase [Galbitalea sp.]|jgi:predicted dehydrogenase
MNDPALGDNARPLKVLVVGTGPVAVENYLPLLSAQPDVTLVLYNRTRAKAEEAAERWGGLVVDSLDAETVAGVDIAFILTTPAPRLAFLNRLIELGVPRIFCEKPFVARDGMSVDADDFSDGLAALRAAEKRGIQLATQFNYRRMATVVLARDLAENRKLGSLVTFTARAHYACWAHTVDLISHLTGGIASVSALESTDIRVGTVLTSKDLAVTLRSRAGAVGTLLGTAATDWDRPLFTMTLVFERGSVELSDFGDPVLLSDYSGSTDEVISLTRVRSRWDEYRASFAASTTAYLESVRAGAPPPVTGLDGVEELRVEAAIRLSVDSNAVVTLDEMLPLGR